jgi:hypothetical protein
MRTMFIPTAADKVDEAVHVAIQAVAAATKACEEAKRVAEKANLKPAIGLI